MNYIDQNYRTLGGDHPGLDRIDALPRWGRERPHTPGSKEPSPRRGAGPVARIAFFDVDKTVLSVNSASLWVRRELRLGNLGRLAAARAFVWAPPTSSAPRASSAPSSRRWRRSAASARRTSTRAPSISGARRSAAFVRPTARARVATHRARGDRVFLLTTSSSYLAHEISAELGCDGYLCTRMEVEDGLFTGRIEPPLCYGEGKVTRAAALAAELGVSLADCSYYGDSYSDLPVLLAVGESRRGEPRPAPSPPRAAARHSRRGLGDDPEMSPLRRPRAVGASGISGGAGGCAAGGLAATGATAGTARRRASRRSQKIDAGHHGRAEQHGGPQRHRLAPTRTARSHRRLGIGIELPRPRLGETTQRALVGPHGGELLRRVDLAHGLAHEGARRVAHPRDHERLPPGRRPRDPAAGGHALERGGHGVHGPVGAEGEGLDRGGRRGLLVRRLHGDVGRALADGDAHVARARGLPPEGEAHRLPQHLPRARRARPPVLPVGAQIRS